MKNTKKIAVLAAALLTTASAGMAIQMRPSTEARAHTGSNNPDAMAQRLQAEVLLGQQATDELSKVLQLILKNGVENVIAALNNDQYLVPVVGGDYYSFIVPNANGHCCCARFGSADRLVESGYERLYFSFDEG